MSSDGAVSAAGTKRAPLPDVASAVKKLARSGGIVRVAPGDYPPLIWRERLARRVSIVGPALGKGRPGPRAVPKVRFAGGSMSGASNLTLRRVAFTEKLHVGKEPKTKRPASNVRFEQVEITSKKRGGCLYIRGASRRVIVRRSWVHGCKHGITGTGSRLEGTARGITISQSLLEDFDGDALRFGWWSDVIIDRNVIRNMRDPEGKIHNDGVQFFGASDNVRLTRNRIQGSDGQLVLIQTAVGPLSRIVLENNVIVDAGANAMQISGASRFRMVNNTVWGGTTLLRESTKHAGALRDAIIANNVFSGLKTYQKPALGKFRRNIVLDPASVKMPGVTRVADLDFRSLRRGDFRLRSSSPARGRADRRLAPRVDMLGQRRARRPSVGAYE